MQSMQYAVSNDDWSNVHSSAVTGNPTLCVITFLTTLDVEVAVGTAVGLGMGDSVGGTSYCGSTSGVGIGCGTGRGAGGVPC